MEYKYIYNNKLDIELDSPNWFKENNFKLNKLNKSLWLQYIILVNIQIDVKK